VADPWQLTKLSAGVEGWNEWRRRYPEASVDLRRASLAEKQLVNVDLNGANLEDSVLHSACLNGANLVGANLCRAKLGLCNLSDANMARADLAHADLFVANLTSAILVGADLTGARFQFTKLAGSDLSGAKVGMTIFAGYGLDDVKGLDSLTHVAPSTVGMDTFQFSKGKLPKSFLQGCGIREDLIDAAASVLLGGVELYSCFISYSSRDGSFAAKLHACLQAQGVRCWRDSEDLKIGDKFQEEIENAIRLYDKLLVVLSESSVTSSWVEREVEVAFEKERRSGSVVLFPVRLDDTVMDSLRPWAADIRRTRHIGDFRNWKDDASFQVSFARLLRDLKTQERPLALR
jgi:uncharacterized protein YjbI with pentapeptide repeats